MKSATTWKRENLLSDSTAGFLDRLVSLFKIVRKKHDQWTAFGYFVHHAQTTSFAFSAAFLNSAVLWTVIIKFPVKGRGIKSFCFCQISDRNFDVENFVVVI